MNYRVMKLFLTATELDGASSALARVARRKTFSEGERAAKQSEVLMAMKYRDCLVEEIRDLERSST